MRHLLFTLSLLPSLAFADGCPTAPDHSRAVDDLIEKMQLAQGEGEARILSNEMWQYLLDAPDEWSQTMLDKALEARRNYDFLKALDRLNALVSYCPHYAEGYNQRAFINFLREDYPAAIPDLEQAIKISPKHIGALTGLALTYFALGETEAAQAPLKDALALNPWLSERHLLAPPPGQEL